MRFVRSGTLLLFVARLCVRSPGERTNEQHLKIEVPYDIVIRRTTCIHLTREGDPMSTDHENQGIQTRLIHGDRAENDSAAVSPPIVQTSTFLLRTPEQGADLA